MIVPLNPFQQWMIQFLVYLRVVPQLFSGVVSMTSLSSICTTPQRGSSRRSRLGSTKSGRLFRLMCTCISAGKQRTIKPCSRPKKETKMSSLYDCFLLWTKKPHGAPNIISLHIVSSFISLKNSCYKLCISEPSAA